MDSVPLILAPGLMCDDALFARQVDYFSDKNSVSVADFTRQNTIEVMASDLLANAPDEFVLAGLSMGGIVAFEVYRQAPERVAALVLMNTTAHADTAEKKKNRQRQMAMAMMGQLEEVVLQELKPNYLAEQSKKDARILSDITAMSGRMGEQVFVQQSQALMSRPDSRATLSNITCPVAIITGDQDELCPPAIHQEIHAQIGHSSLHVLEDCGHLSTMEQPERVNAIIEQCLQAAMKEEPVI